MSSDGVAAGMIIFVADAEDTDPTRDWHPADNLDAVGVSEPGWWLRALVLTADRLHAPPEGMIGPDKQVDARFFIVALERFRTTIVKISAPQLPDEVQGRATVALAAFDHVAGRQAIAQARNVLMHSDEYLAGKGNAQRRTPAQGKTAGELSTQYATGIGYHPGDIVRVGSVNWPDAPTFHVAAVVAAARELALTMYSLARQPVRRNASDA